MPGMRLNLDVIAERPHRDPDARAASAERRASESARSARRVALDLAKAGVSAELLASAALCTVDTAHTTLSTLRAEGKLERFARGWYQLPGTGPKKPERQGGMVSAARADRREKEAQLSAADLFFADRAQFPGATTALPGARVADFEAPLRRRRA